MLQSKKVYNLGYESGVYDQNHFVEYIDPHSDFGIYYADGYKKGYEDAKIKKWYIVAYSSDKITNKIIDSYMQASVEFNRGFGWGEKATAFVFSNQEDAMKRLNELCNSVGRGYYNVIWE